MGNGVGKASNLVRNAMARPVHMDMGNAVDRVSNWLRNYVGRRGSVNNTSGPWYSRFNFDEKDLDFDEKDLESEESLWGLYERWIRFHNVQRSMEEKHKRFNKFKAQAHYVHNRNKEEEKKGLPEDIALVFCLDQFADWTDKEIGKLYATKCVKARCGIEQ